MTRIPDYMPVLSEGAHDNPSEGGCVMEYVSLLAGEEWSDTPACTHPVLAKVAQAVNDRLDDSERHRLVPLIPRLLGTAPTGTNEEQQVLSVRLACWCARQVLDLTRDEDRAVCERAIDTAEAWTRGEATREEVAAAGAAAWSAAGDAAWDAARAAAGDVAGAAAWDAAAAAAGGDRALVALLTGLLDEHDRLTGRTVTVEEQATTLGRLAEVAQ